MTMTADEAFQKFAQQWAEKNPNFRLDDPEVREDLMTVVSAMMSLLAVADPETWNTFMEGVAQHAKNCVPEHIQKLIKDSIE